MKAITLAAGLILLIAAPAQACEINGQKVRVLSKKSAGNGYTAYTVKGRGGVFVVLHKGRLCR